MKRVVFLGAKDIGRVCLEHIVINQKRLDFELVGVFVGPKDAGIKEFCAKEGIALFSELDDLCSLRADIGFSIQYHQILSPKHLQSISEMAFNLHLAPLPEYRGCNQFSFALLHEEREFGVSIHQMDCGIDSGDIIFQRRFAIPEQCFVDELVELASYHGIALFCEHFDEMIQKNYTLTPQASIKAAKKEFHLRNEINQHKAIALQACGGGAD